MPQEERQGKILISKAGGNACPDAKHYRVALPAAWVAALGVNGKDRMVTLQFDGDSITIRRPAASTYDAFLSDVRSSGHDLLILHYYDGDTLCTKICADRTTRRLVIENMVSDTLSTAFGINQKPTWRDLQTFLKSRCVPQTRDGLSHYLAGLGLDHYDPLDIIRKTDGRMAEDPCWIKIVEG